MLKTLMSLSVFPLQRGKTMNIINKLKVMGDIEVPLSVVVILVAVAVILAQQPVKEVYYLPVDPSSQKIHSI